MTRQEAFERWRQGDFSGCEATYRWVWRENYGVVKEYLSRIPEAARFGEPLIEEGFVAAMLELDAILSAQQCSLRIEKELGAPENLSQQRAGGWRWACPLVRWPGEHEFQRATYLCWIKHCTDELRLRRM